ncbi:siderophore-interacting protein [Microbacterium halophytorum]|uniref:siderophore-interacting protein n=1 Tax=Microbacterium halophytorum TaxID=2067568 RepID=UPI000CFD359D|nr:siderophore-interacting protein [Microbacterium halophytorum]
MSNITVTHAESGLVRAEVVRRERVTPNMVRVTLGGADLDRYEHRGFDQWFRLALPVRGEGGLDRMPSKFGIGGYVKYLTLPKGTRPVIRNYTVRAFRPAERELDVDFVSHGDDGVAGPWAASVEPGERVAFIDQGCGWKPVAADWSLIVADESALPAAAGVLRDMPRDAVGHAIIELFDARDRQVVDAPDGVAVHWLERGAGEAPGAAALPLLRGLDFPGGEPYAFCVGEQALAAGARRHLVKERGIDKRRVTFSGYWRIGQASPS